MSIEVVTAEAMFNLGLSLSAHLKAGDLILVNGPLGAGKTVLAQGIGKGLGITDITSPTFVISRVHKATLPMIHVDAYRLIDTDNPNLYVDDLDLDTARESAVTVFAALVRDARSLRGGQAVGQEVADLADHVAVGRVLLHRAVVDSP